MKQTETAIIILLTLFVAIFTYELTIKEKTIIILNKKVKSLEVKKLPIGMVTIGKNTLQVVTSRPDRHLHVKELKPGKNYYDFAMNEGQRVEIYVWNY